MTAMVWGDPLVRLLLNPELIIPSIMTCNTIRLIRTEFRNKSPLTFAAIAHGPIPRPHENTVAVAIKWTTTSILSGITTTRSIYHHKKETPTFS